MGGHLAAGTLTARSGTAGPAARRTHGFVVETAVPEDDGAIRKLLRESVFPGEVSLSLEREPDSFAAAAIEGDQHQTLVARESGTGRVIATAGRSVREVYVNGGRERIGYLGQFRIDPGARQRSVLDAGFAAWRALHDESAVRADLLGIVADNAPARRMLERRRPGWPALVPVDCFVTLVIPVVRSASDRRRTGLGSRDGLTIVPGTEVGFPALCEFLQRSNARLQFAPRWTAGDLESPRRSRNLDLADFAVALRNGSIAGCVACWDQRAFKQIVVRGYSRRLSFARPFVNAVARWTGGPLLPVAGTPLQSAYLSHLAVDEDDEDVFERLVEEGRRRGREKGVVCVTLGLSARRPLLGRARRSFPHRAYESMLYLGCWPDGEAFARALDGRPSHPELAIL